MGKEFAKELFAHFSYCNPEKDEVSVLESLYFVLCLSTLAPPWKLGLPISRRGSIRFSKRVYPIFEEGLPDSVGACPLCKAGGPSGGAVPQCKRPLSVP